MTTPELMSAVLKSVVVVLAFLSAVKWLAKRDRACRAARGAVDDALRGHRADPYGHRKPKTPEQVAETLRRASSG